MRITSRLVAEPVWVQGPSGRSRPGVPRGLLCNAVEDGRLLVLQFLADGKRIERTPAWQRASELLGSRVAVVLRRITTSRDALLLSIGGPSIEKRRLGGRNVTLTSDEHILLEYALAGRSQRFAFHERRGADEHESRLLIEPAQRDVSAIVRAGWGWGTLRSYTVPRSKVDLAVKAWSKIEEPTPWRELAALSSYAKIACEEWSDGGALRFWSTALAQRALAKRLAPTRTW